ncbi:hypothetical protein EST38_g11912 [Candolleomyces aberdarensis]|uniref:Uncharacterized protein n=1 Tax=Candolleomyces aberdarensis TaxID=2316362 RepID=A0A4Q2D715_9AGAR|nr:hypothetical protein EST38_g11912 [Candolleomyces aberdarensis]
MATFDVTAAQIVGLFMASVFYGIYLITFFSCIRVLLWRDGKMKSWGSINKMMVLAAFGMLVFGTLDVSFGLRRNLDAFVFQFAKGVHPADEFAEISDWVNVMKFADYAAQTFIGDGILIYRCYIIFNKRWRVVVLPILMWLATAVCSGVTVYIEATIGSGDLGQSQFEPFISSTLSLTLATNVITTALIVYRIYKIQSRAANHTVSTGSTSSPYSRLIRTLIECGAMYTASIIVLFACYLADSNAILPVSNSVVQIIGITFNLLILNIDRGSATQPMSSLSNSAFSGSNGLALHQLRIKTVTTMVRDPMPDEYIIGSQVGSRVRRGHDEESLYESTVDVEKAKHSSSPDNVHEEPRRNDVKQHAF